MVPVPVRNRRAMGIFKSSITSELLNPSLKCAVSARCAHSAHAWNIFLDRFLCGTPHSLDMVEAAPRWTSGTRSFGRTSAGREQVRGVGTGSRICMNARPPERPRARCAWSSLRRACRRKTASGGACSACSRVPCSRCTSARPASRVSARSSRGGKRRLAWATSLS
ncbi:uncharacterized protein C8Q71DRAFT_108579 [Rhodofomes roseus]|uniref:Uncharacterized protein n=1 Tax=Rhodofomes roseus TaxID=34475 RepID=A0ABQ8KC71_9APHY|nr:uncharacterized protein C8Q71DRAFT_108579 [Rhodofomes roseus]KAH9835200.1 hypothetical protein C8Q71DRAFT_108579 [Rhodofomes roseus]